MKRQRKTHVTTTTPTAVPGALLLLAAMLPTVPSGEPEKDAWGWREGAESAAPLRVGIFDGFEEDEDEVFWKLPEGGRWEEPRQRWELLSVRTRDALQVAGPGRWSGYELCVSGFVGASVEEWERYHGGVLGVDGGCAWHILVGRDGVVEVSERWLRQLDGPGGVGAVRGRVRICFLAGAEDGPTVVQWDAADEVLDYLEARTGVLKGVWGVEDGRGDGCFRMFEGRRGGG